MRFSYLDILEQCFHEKFRGYNKQEVDTFLQLVANDFEDMEEEIETLKGEIDYKGQQIEKLEKTANGKSGNNSWGAISPEVIRDKARQIINLAQEKAEQQRKKSEQNLRHLRAEIQHLKGEKDNLLKNIKLSAKNYIESLQKKSGATTPGGASKNKKK